MLPCAVANNPDRQVVLLGDESNQKVAVDSGATHIPYSDFEYGDDLEKFDELFQVIKGPASNASEFWLRFVFKRWFLIANLIEREEIQKFWHFDSDNMLVEPLSSHEHYFQSVDCTEQCGGSCLNGFVNQSGIVRTFVKKINSLFEDEGFLSEQRRNVLEDPRTHFNEMVAYSVFRDTGNIRRERLFQIRDGAIFDDAVCHCEQFEEESLRTGETMKRLMVSPDGGFFGFIENDQNPMPIRFASLNLSWVPLYVYRNVYRHSLNRTQAQSKTPPDLSALKPFRNLPIPIGEFWKYRLRLATRSIRRSLASGLSRLTG